MNTTTVHPAKSVHVVPKKKRPILRNVVAALVLIPFTLAIIAGLGYYKYTQILGFIKLAQSGAFAPPPSAVTTLVVRRGTWESGFRAVGNVAPINGVMLSNELEGIVSKINFQSGTHLRRGEVLVELDAGQEKAQLAQAEARRDLALLTLGRDRDLLAKHTISKSESDAAEADARQMEANVQLYKATIDKKTIRAPFDGVAGIRLVDLGQYLKVGQSVVAFHSFNPTYVNLYVPQRLLASVHPGQKVSVRTESFPDREFTGQVTAINSQVDPERRNVQVQATIANDAELLRPGVFVNVAIELAAARDALSVPASAVDYSPQGTAVFVLTDAPGKDGKPPGKAVHRQPVRLGESQGDRVEVLSGLNGGEEIVTAGLFRLRDGGAVVVNNSVQPENELNPTPADS